MSTDPKKQAKEARPARAGARWDQTRVKNLVPIVLFALSLGLCVVVGIQWAAEGRLRKQMEEMAKELRGQSHAALNQELALRKAQEEIQRLESVRQQLNNTVKTNTEALVTFSKRLQGVGQELGTWQKQSELYQSALSQANDSINRQNEDIRKQNEDIKRLASYRDELIAKYNKLAADHNELVRRWNKQQEELARATSNPGYQPAR